MLCFTFISIYTTRKKNRKKPLRCCFFLLSFHRLVVFFHLFGFFCFVNFLFVVFACTYHSVFSCLCRCFSLIVWVHLLNFCCHFCYFLTFLAVIVACATLQLFSCMCLFVYCLCLTLKSTLQCFLVPSRINNLFK